MNSVKGCEENTITKRREFTFGPFAVIAMSFALSACSYLGFDGDQTSVYNVNDEYTPVERVEANTYGPAGPVEIANQ